MSGSIKKLQWFFLGSTVLFLKWLWKDSIKESCDTERCWFCLQFAVIFPSWKDLQGNSFKVGFHKNPIHVLMLHFIQNFKTPVLSALSSGHHNYHKRSEKGDLSFFMHSIRQVRSLGEMTWEVRFREPAFLSLVKVEGQSNKNLQLFHWKLQCWWS